jgi:diaminopimelate decarboxylase
LSFIGRKLKLNQTNFVMTLSEKVLAQVLKLVQKEYHPFYLYNTSRIRLNCRMFLAIPYLNKSIHYATMANIHPGILNIVRDEKMNVFVNSLLHLEKVRDAGFRQDEITFSASALDDKSFRIINNSGTRVNLDSKNQIQRWKKAFPKKSFGIRCNIGTLITPKQTHAGYFIGRESRLGLTTEEITELKGDKLVKGLHIYVGTDILDVDYFLHCYETLCQFIDLFPNLEYLNFGGGFGIKENGERCFNMEEYRPRVSRLMSEISDGRNKVFQLILEPGRIIAGNAGYFVTRVTDIKERNGCQYIGVNASSVQFPRPLLYPEIARHPVALIRNGEQAISPKKKVSFIYGCSTYSRDFLARSIQLPPAEIGDLVIFGNAGAYSAAACTDFLGFPRPKEFLL